MFLENGKMMANKHLSGLRGSVAVFLLALSLLVSCSEPLAQQDPETGREQPAKRDSATFTAYVEQDGTKTVLSEGRHVLWSEDDEIRVFNAATPAGEVYSLQNGAGTGKGTFSGPVLPGEGPYYAVYPATAATSLSGTSVSVVLQTEQTYVENSFGPGANLAAASAERLEDLHFFNVCGYISITLTGAATVTGVGVYTRGNDLLNGSGVIGSIDSGSPALSMDSGQSGEAFQSVYLRCDGGVALTSEGKTFYVVVPPGSLEEGFTLEVAATDGSVMLKNGKAGSVTIQRSKTRSMPAFGYSPQYQAAFLQTDCLSGAFTGTLAGSTLQAACVYEEPEGQYAYATTSGDSGSRLFRIQSWDNGYALTLTTPYVLNAGKTVAVAVEVLGETGDISSGTSSMKVLKKTGERAWLVDPATGNGFVMMMLEE